MQLPLPLRRYLTHTLNVVDKKRSEIFECIMLNLIPIIYGEELKKTIGAPEYIECSSKTQLVRSSLL